MKKIKLFFKKVFNLIVSLFLAAVDLIIYIFAVIALYQGDYTTALLIMFFGIAMEIRKGLKPISEKRELELVKIIFTQISKELRKESDNEKS